MIFSLKIRKLFLSMAAIFCLNGLLISAHAAIYDVEDFKEMVDCCEFGRFGLNFPVSAYVQMKINYLRAIRRVVVKNAMPLKKVRKLLKLSGLLNGSVLSEVKFLFRHSKTYTEFKQNLGSLIVAYEWFNSQRR